MGLESVAVGACILGFGLFLILCAVIWGIRYLHYRDEYRKKTGIRW